VEKKTSGQLGPGDVVLFYSGYSDKYYKTVFRRSALRGRFRRRQAPAWPGPDPGCMEYLASRK